MQFTSMQSQRELWHIFHYGKCSKILNPFLFLVSTKMLALKAGIHKMLFNIANTGKTLITASQKQPDLGLLCLPMPFWQATGVRNFSTFTVVPEFI